MSYGTKEGFVAYHTARGREVPALWDDEVIQAALLVGSEWIDHIYGNLFIGYPTGGYDQARQWPRTTALTENIYPQKVFTDSEIPDAVVNAAYEAAWRQATTPGSLMVDYTPGKYKRVSVEGAISVDYAQFTSSSDVQIQIGAIDNLLWPLLKKQGNFSNLSGGSNRV